MFGVMVVKTENLISHDNYVSSSNFLSSTVISRLVSSQRCVHTCTPQSLFFFLFTLTCSITCGLFLYFFFRYFSLHLLPIVLYMPYIFIIFHQHSFDVQLYLLKLLPLSLSPALYLDRQSETEEEATKNSWKPKRR